MPEPSAIDEYLSEARDLARRQQAIVEAYDELAESLPSGSTEHLEAAQQSLARVDEAYFAAQGLTTPPETGDVQATLIQRLSALRSWLTAVIESHDLEGRSRRQAERRAPRLRTVANEAEALFWRQMDSVPGDGSVADTSASPREALDSTVSSSGGQRSASGLGQSALQPPANKPRRPGSWSSAMRPSTRRNDGSEGPSLLVTLRVAAAIAAALALVLIALATASSVGDELQRTESSAVRVISFYAEGLFWSALTIGLLISAYIFTRRAA